MRSHTTATRLVTAARHALALLALASLPASGPTTAAQTVSSDDPIPLLEGLGHHHYAITTNVPAAQTYFDQGIRLYYAFNHAEAIRAFREAARLDPECAMCFWGIALAYGPNINAPMDEAAGLAAYDALQQALAVAGHTSAREEALIDALARRYAPEAPADRAALDQAFSDAMEQVVEAYPDDLEARTLYAESLMDLSPWEYWNRDGSPRPRTPGLLSQLEHVMAADPDHPGANHFYIHAVEAVQPERAVNAAERLAGLMPAAGHLVHMPGHIYVRVGRYRDAIEANEHAVHADETYIRDHNPAFGMYLGGYYPHNYDFLAFASSMIGRRTQAITAAEKLAAIVPEEMLAEPGMGFLQHHHTRHLQLKVRFSQWEEILDVAPPAEDLPHARAMWHYARGRAFAAQGEIPRAETELAALHALAEDPTVMTLRLEFNGAEAVLAIAREVLAGHLAAAKQNLPNAITHLREAAALEDQLVYGEPPEWTVPVRQELGEILLQAGHPAEAEHVFREDLDRFPDNGWSLYGLAQALSAQHRTADADAMTARFHEAWSTADVEPPIATVTTR